jgi:hypothetical protein
MHRPAVTSDKPLALVRSFAWSAYTPVYARPDDPAADKTCSIPEAALGVRHSAASDEAEESRRSRPSQSLLVFSAESAMFDKGARLQFGHCLA